MNSTTADVAESTEEIADSVERASSAASDADKTWSSVHKTTVNVNNNFAEMTAAILAQAELFRNIDRAEAKAAAARKKAAADQKKSDDAANKAVADRAKQSKKLVDDTKSVASNLAGATVTLLKWASLGTIAGGLLGAGGLFGLDRLAMDVGDNRRSAQGLGISTAEKRAFGLDFGRYVDPSLLDRVSEAQSDVSKRWAFGASGVQNVDSMNAAQAASQMLLAAKKFADTHNPNSYVNMMGATGLDQFFSLADIKRLHETPLEDIQNSAGDYGTDRGSLGLTNDTQKRWQDFSIQMSRAGSTIENVFVRGLEPLVPALTNLSASFTTAVEAFMESPHLKEWIESLGKGIEKFATYIGSSEFENNVRDFVDDVSALAHAIVNALRWLGVVPRARDEGDKWEHGGRQDMLDDDSEGGRPTSGGAGAPQKKSPWNDPRLRDDAPSDDGTPTKSSWSAPTDMMARILQAESSGGTNAGYSRAGALGPYQLMPETAKQYGVTDRTDPVQSARGARAYMSDLLKKYSGDTARALAAYNWGPSNVDRDVASHGDAWRSFLPAETRAYLDKTDGSTSSSTSAGGAPPALGSHRQVLITINNNTGGSAAASTNQQVVPQ